MKELFHKMASYSHIKRELLKQGLIPPETRPRFYDTENPLNSIPPQQPFGAQHPKASGNRVVINRTPDKFTGLHGHQIQSPPNISPKTKGDMEHMVQVRTVFYSDLI